MGKNGLEQIKVYIPNELKDKFKAKIFRDSETQTNVIRKMIHNYIKDK